MTARKRTLSPTRRFDGAVAIEYGLVLPALLLFVLGVMDVGRLLWTYTTLCRATTAAARCGSVNGTLCGTSSQIQNYAVAQAWGLTISTSAFAVSYPACGLQVKGAYTFKFVIPWIDPSQPFSNTLTLNATACSAMQY